MAPWLARLLSTTLANDKTRHDMTQHDITRHVVCVGSSRARPGRRVVNLFRAVGVGDGRVAWAALRRGDWWGGRRLGGAVSLKLLGTTSSGWRCLIGIAGQGVVWVALCHWDCWKKASSGRCFVMGIAGHGVVWVALCHWNCWGGRRLGGAASGWRCVIGIAGHGVVWVALCHWDCWGGRRVGGGASL